jgi:hypothetical protein
LVTGKGKIRSICSFAFLQKCDEILYSTAKDTQHTAAHYSAPQSHRIALHSRHIAPQRTTLAPNRATSYLNRNENDRDVSRLRCLRGIGDRL